MLLSDNTYDWLASMLQLVEEGQPWPKEVNQAKAAYLSKDPDKAEDPLEYRLLYLYGYNRLLPPHSLAGY